LLKRIILRELGSNKQAKWAIINGDAAKIKEFRITHNMMRPTK